MLMSNIEKNVREDITKEMLGDKKFCVSIMECKDRKEVKELLASKGIDAGDSDINDLADNISEIADICRKLDENELDHIAGGIDRYDVITGALAGGGVFLIVAGSLGVLSLVASAIKKGGDKKGWWNKDKRKTN